MKTAVVTGASSGVGYALAEALAADGYRVYGLCRRSSVPPNMTWKQCDVTQRDSIRQAVREIAAEGGVDVWVNNAGMGIAGAMECAREEDVRRQFEVNLFGSIWCTQEIFPVMRAQGAGRILFVSSLAGVFPIPFQTFYSASKSAVNTVSDAAGLEGKPFGIETCTLLLNDVRTGFTDARETDAAGNDAVYGGRVLASIKKMEDSERNGMAPEQVAQCAVRLLHRKKLPPHKIVGFGSELLGVLNRILPAKAIMALLGSIYGGK